VDTVIIGFAVDAPERRGRCAHHGFRILGREAAGIERFSSKDKLGQFDDDGTDHLALEMTLQAFAIAGQRGLRIRGTAAVLGQ